LTGSATDLAGEVCRPWNGYRVIWFWWLWRPVAALSPAKLDATPGVRLTAWASSRDGRWLQRPPQRNCATSPVGPLTVRMPI